MTELEKKRSKWDARGKNLGPKWDNDTFEGDEDFHEYVPMKRRKIEMVKKVAQRRKMPSQQELERDAERKRLDEVIESGPKSSRSLLEEREKVLREQELKNESTVDQILKEEKEIMERIKNTRDLKSVQDLAKGIKFNKSIHTGWHPPRWATNRDPYINELLRAKYHIDVEGENVAPPISTFRGMKVHRAIVDALDKKGITLPTPIQLQGLPVLLSGRDMVGVAFTGSGKTLTFTLPAVMFCLDQERKLPFLRNEGPYAVIMAPARELTRQTWDFARDLCKALRDYGEPEIRAALVSGGVGHKDMMGGQQGGPHIAVCTPGRLQDMLKKGTLNFEVCRYFCLDEADRMIDLGFEEEIRTILSYFNDQRQTVLFSATMPTKIKEFAYSALVNPVTVNVGRAGAANLDVIQEVEYVKQEAKVMYLLECLQKTPPPVMVFSSRKQDVDDMYEYLLLKGVEAVAIHGGKDQEERDLAIRSFKNRDKDVLVATDVASKGLDFADIQHVINFDMPDELEYYVHRIGRTGRSGKTGIATTFINRMVDPTTLMDLKYLLIEAKQRVPPFLEQHTRPGEELLKIGGTQGCLYCGGPGHRIGDCPKRQDTQNQETRNIGRSDFLRERGSEV
eukprot:m.146492 g.146492  ORF g.146492 m.146492 type:complete len:621 (-) comp30481_c0_seq1:100-1962(-)